MNMYIIKASNKVRRCACALVKGEVNCSNTTQGGCFNYLQSKVGKKSKIDGQQILLFLGKQ